jgi:hypothetical protein
LESDTARLLATAVIEQAVLDARIAFSAGIINDQFQVTNQQQTLPTGMMPRDVHSLASFFNRNLDDFVEHTGLKINPDAIRYGTRKNIDKTFKRICHESPIQDYERRWKVNPISARPAKRARRKAK